MMMMMMTSIKLQIKLVLNSKFDLNKFGLLHFSQGILHSFYIYIYSLYMYILKILLFPTYYTYVICCILRF